MIIYTLNIYLLILTMVQGFIQIALNTNGSSRAYVSEKYVKSINMKI